MLEYTASRWSQSNRLFPAHLIIDERKVTGRKIEENFGYIVSP